MLTMPGSEEKKSVSSVSSCQKGRNPIASTAATTQSPLRAATAAGPWANGPQACR
ncbi:hypothetical protein D3C83_326730 [compost metagenome]